MTSIPRKATMRTTLQPSIRGLLATVFGLLLLTTACTTPGAVAPSTLPLGNYVGIGGKETSSSCGYTLLMIPIGFSQPVSDVIDEMISSRGGDALVEVSSQSWTTWYLLGWANCFEITGKVVKVSR
jgi:hypothetical protein